MRELTVRPLMPDDAETARAALTEGFRGTSYLPRMLELLDSALRFEDPEYLCVLAEAGGATVGLVLFGTIVGAARAAKVHAVVAVEPRVHRALLDAVTETCARSGERLVVCELPDDVPFHLAGIALLASGYREEGRIDDFVRQGIALRLLVWRPDAAEDAPC